jgi:pilus assembly protein CpaF
MTTSLWERLQQKKLGEHSGNQNNKTKKVDNEDLKKELEESKNEEVDTSSDTTPTKEEEDKKSSKVEVITPKVDTSLRRTNMKRSVFLKIKNSIQNTLIEEISLEELKEKSHDPEFRKTVKARIEELVEQQNLPLTKEDKLSLSKNLLYDTIGLGPIEPLLADPTISEIMVNHANQVYVERSGKLVLTEVFFDDDYHVLQVIDRIISPLNRHVDESNPYVDARLADGSRVNAIIPPLSIKGPCLTIRKFAADPFTVDDLIQFGTFTPEVAKFLEACVRARLNVVVSGGTGSGKTTTLNVLSSFVPADERIVTIEDAAELQLRQPHVVTLEARPAGISGTGAVTIRDLVRNSLRMRPDRIIVGECRGGEALDMLQAMNTGHDGSMTTGHANSPRDMLARLETMVLMSGMELPVKAIREQISSAIDVIIQQSRLKDGSRKIVNITEVQKMEGDVITLQDIFVFKQTGFDKNGKILGQLEPTGIRPSFMDVFEAYGIEVEGDVFYKK